MATENAHASPREGLSPALSASSLGEWDDGAAGPKLEFNATKTSSDMQDTFGRRRVKWKNAARWIGNGCAMEFGGQLKKEGFWNQTALVVVVEFKDGFKNY